MSWQRSHIIPQQHGLAEGGDQMARRQEEEARRAAAESYRQFRLRANAPIIWPPALAEQQQQQLAFLWAQIDPRDQQRYIQELHRSHPPHAPPPIPENAVRGVEPFRLMNQQGQIINVIEDVSDETNVDMAGTSNERVNEDVNEEYGTSTPMISEDGRVMFLIR